MYGDAINCYNKAGLKKEARMVAEEAAREAEVEAEVETVRAIPTVVEAAILVEAEAAFAPLPNVSSIDFPTD